MRQLRIALAGGALVAAAACLLLAHAATRQFVGYDSAWHVFISLQPAWTSFWREVRDNAHPPLFYLLVRSAVGVMGRTLLAYRIWSIAGIGVASLLLARVACRLTGSAVLGIAAAAAFGFSATSIELGLEIRSYAVFLAFAVGTVCAYVEWLDARPGRDSPWARVLFALALSGAILSHYSAFFLLGATLAVPPLLWISHRRWRARLARELRSHLPGAGAMFGVPLAVAATVYFLHLRRYPHVLEHVAGFMFDRRAETPLAFVLRNTRNLAVLFLPGVGLSTGAETVAALVLIVGLFLLLARIRGRVAVVPFAMLLCMSLANLAAALRGRYPYGGYVRHEVFLYPFLLLSLFTGFEAARRAVPPRFRRRAVWAGAAAVLAGASSWHAVATYPFSSEELFHKQLDRFDHLFPLPPAVMSDQFNFIILFGHFHDWTWRLRWQEPRSSTMWQVWDVSQGTERFAVCRERAWQSDFTRPDVYSDANECLVRAATGRVVIFRLQQPGVPAAPKDADVRARATVLASAVTLTPGPLVVDGDDVLAAFDRQGEPDGTPALRVVAATYGENCHAPSGNATAAIREACDGWPACFARAGRIGDPAPGCAKDFKVTFRCGAEPAPRSAALPPAVDLAAGVVLSCQPR